MRLIKFTYLFIFLGFMSCGHFSKSDSGVVKITGKIVNPRTSKMYVSKDFLMIEVDTLNVDNTNKINTTINIDHEGLYLCSIFPEFQLFYLKPNDSLAFHINVDEFDESLSFSEGLGFENNLLMDLFLINEKENYFFYKRQQKFSLEAFLQKIDSFDQIKKKLLMSNHELIKLTSPKFRKIVDLYANSVTYNLKEQYVKNHPKLLFSEAFLSYRKIFNKPIADAGVIDLYSFIDRLINNKVSKVGMNAKEYYAAIVDFAKNNIKDKNMRDNILTKYCGAYIESKKITKEDVVVKHFMQEIGKEKYKEFCRKKIIKNAKMQKGNVFPNINLIDKYRHLQNNDTITKQGKYLVTFWNYHYRKNFTENLKKLYQLHSDYPNLNIMILNLNPDDYDSWRMQIPDNDGLLYFQVRDARRIKEIKPFHLAQVYLVGQAKIKQSMLNLYDPNFKQIIENFMTEKE